MLDDFLPICLFSSFTYLFIGISDLIVTHYLHLSAKKN